MRGSIGDKVRLLHILDGIREIEGYILQADFDAFLNNSMMRFACVKQLEIIGEASGQITEEKKQQFPMVEWNKMKGMRNILVHEYFGIDIRVVWEIIIDDLPGLKKQVEEILKSIESGHNH